MTVFMTPEEQAQWRADMKSRWAKVDAEVARRAGEGFTPEEIENIRAMLEMGASEGACMYGYTDSDDDAAVFVERVMRALGEGNTVDTA